jgi:hypothetical protein
MHSPSTDLGEVKVGKWEQSNGCRNGHNSHVLCLSDTTLSAASMRARIMKEITEDGYDFYVYV